MLPVCKRRTVRPSRLVVITSISMETNSFPRRVKRNHQLPNRLEYAAELRVVFLLQCIEPSRQVFMRDQPAAQTDERTHDFHGHLYGAPAVQHARQHCNSLFGEGVRGMTTATPARI